MTLPHFLTFIINFIGSNEFLLVVQSSALLFKIVILGFFIKRMIYTENIPAAWIYLLMVIIGAAMEDFSWIVSLTHKTLFPTANYFIVLICIRIGWALNILTYQALSLFIESFKNKRVQFRTYHYIFGAISFGFFLAFVYIGLTAGPKTSAFENILREIESMYALLLLLPVTIISAFYSLRNTRLPLIVRLQLKTCVQFFLLPHLVANLCQVYPFKFSVGILANHPAAVGISAIFLSLTIFHCIKKIVGLRFLDLHEHVHDNQNFNFIDDFKILLEDLGNASNSKEIKLLTQHFFSKAFDIQSQDTSLSIRINNQLPQKDHSEMIDSYTQATIETFIGSHNENFKEMPEALVSLKKNKILIYDEIAYNHFHNPSEARNTILSFLEKINADVFLPIYENNSIIAYITVQRHARNGKLYTDIERDEVLVFGSYLSKIINLLQNRNLGELLKQRKDIMEELYIKHQEITRYKESIRSFLRSPKENHIGILFYKNRKFSFGNKSAAEMLCVNPNTQQGDPLTKTLKALAQQVEIYKTTQTQMTKNSKGNRLILSGIPHPEHHGSIITIHYPEISDTIKRLLDHIKDPSSWDYLLYLETTKSGRLINNLIPSSCESLLNFKIDLLKLALSKKALLLDLPEDDLIPTVELLHHISLRETMHVLTIHAPITTPDIPITLFGMNTLFGSTPTQPLLDKLNKKGTLFIKNIHFLDLETQNNLAEFIRYGSYRVFKSDKKIQSDVRIITSTSQNLSQLVQEGIFSQTLFNELRHTSLTLPSLLTLDPTEIDTLVEGFTEQALTDNVCNKLLSLTDKEKAKIAGQRPISLQELKRKVQNLLIAKSKKTEVYDETEFDPAYNISDPRLAEAARLGKYALKDPKIMSLLWGKFKNQNKIATFLGVNRSSVHRRCKDYGLL
jgi:hypothetical protein